MRHLKTLQCFDQVVRTGSIRKASEALNLTASALNRRILDIEEEVGAKLFERGARGMRLTAAGELFARFARNQFAEAELVQSQIEDLKGLSRGVVRIAASQALAHGVLPQAVQAFQLRYPLIAFEVTICDQARAMQALARLEVDIVLVFRPPQSPTFEPLLRMPQRLVAQLAEDHPLAAKPMLTLAECRRYPLALPERSIGGRQLLEEASARSGVALKPVIESNSFEFLRRCLPGGQAISFQIEVGALPGFLHGSGIVCRPVDPRDVPSADLVLGRLRQRNLPIAASKFCEHLRATLTSTLTR